MNQEIRREWDYILVGGGLQNLLVTLLLLHKDPEIRVLLLEQESHLGGNHTWSFHETDLPYDCLAALHATLRHRWHGYDVYFPSFHRRVHLGYGAIPASHLAAVVSERVSAAPHAEIRLFAPVATVQPDQVVLVGGEEIGGRHIIDARGPDVIPPSGDAGYQKFVGLEVRLEKPCALTRPVLMDACVPQEDGFRFFYVMPFAPDRLLIEDTRFSEQPHFEHREMAAAVLSYADSRGYAVSTILREESGVLPMPCTAAFERSRAMPLRAGYGGGFFHPATGYSLPVALRLARHIAEHAPDTPLGSDWSDFLDRHARQYRFATRLNRLLFRAFAPDDRHHVLRWFYRLPEPVIARFYALQLTHSDIARIFLGRPPEGFSMKRIFEGAPHP